MLAIPKIGQGTWQMERDDRAAAIRALRHGLDLGLTHIDTAEMYGSGEVESIVGEAIAGRRDEVFLATKVLPTNASRQGTVRACEQSLARLGTDHVDLYMLHWPGSHPLEDTFAAFEQLRDQGKVRHFGVSNFDRRELDAALAITDDIACNQVLYHPGERAIEHDVIPWCQKHGVPVVAYSPFGSGRFPAANTEGGRALNEVASRHQATARQVALAFVVRLDGVVTIPKASRTEHVTDNAGANGLALADVDVALLSRAFPLGQSRALPFI